MRIRNRLGMHARAATVFVQLASRFVCELRVRKDDIEVNGKSIMGVLQLAAAQGTDIEVEADGPDADQALAALARLVEDRFGEDE
ncbi:MAG TPA: HPr family phosphocarrier protein [Myxococcota bacterium]|nr:HPr family phosphocarrier protein [Myxococcota bacterium]HRY95316.1 HPr family phosphocarrier protein [Myxococcota bacterium]HSA20770.1 HPr family phosphocarrier protein [Myxococcota bacterium]